MRKLSKFIFDYATIFQSQAIVQSAQPEMLQLDLPGLWKEEMILGLLMSLNIQTLERAVNELFAKPGLIYCFPAKEIRSVRYTAIQKMVVTWKGGFSVASS